MPLPLPVSGRFPAVAILPFVVPYFPTVSAPLYNNRRTDTIAYCLLGQFPSSILDDSRAVAQQQGIRSIIV